MSPWAEGALRSPASGRVLRADTAWSLCEEGGTDGAGRWPVIEGIPFLRVGREGLAARALAALDAGREEEALGALLADQDDWARSAPPGAEAVRAVVGGGMSFRGAMEALAFGGVGTYFAHRWSDPTFLSGLALAEAHGPLGAVFELACGAGHFLREFGRGGEAAAGGDVVFAKLWLARRYVAPGARLVCFDAAKGWPLGDGAFETVFCHDAFYFLPEKAHVAGEMRRVSRGRVLVGHMHNALVDNLSAGSPMDPAGYAGLFEGGVMYDDRELTAALVEARAPEAAGVGALGGAAAVSVAWGAGEARVVRGGVAVPEAGTALRRNPLYEGARVAWPSERYRVEYGGLATYPMEVVGPERAVAGETAEVEALARRRVLLDLPARW